MTQKDKALYAFLTVLVTVYAYVFYKYISYNHSLDGFLNIYQKNNYGFNNHSF